MKRVIMNPFSPLPKSDKSHVRGWAQVWAERLNADIADKHTDISVYDEIYIDNGVNFSGGLNLFGGFNDEVTARLIELESYCHKGAKLISLDYDMAGIDYASQIEKRLGAKSTSSMLTPGLIEASRSMFSGAETLTMNDLPLTNMILGDSHSVAYATSDQIISRNNGKTLYSAMLQDPSFEWVLSILEPVRHKLEKLTLCFGSIDIRFHAIREGRDSAEIFSQKYSNAAIRLSDILGIPVSVCAPVPVEFEGRRIPGTGKYEGQSFFGSREERLQYTLDFINSIDIDLDVVSPPRHWYALDGEVYAKEIMEAASSVHIAPKHYNSVLNWGIL